MSDYGWFRIGMRLTLVLGAAVGPLIAVNFYLYGWVFVVFLFGVPLLVVACVLFLIRRRQAGLPGLLELACRKLERARAWIHRVRRRRRVRRVEQAASQAGRHEELLSPEGVRTSAAALFGLVHLGWHERDCGRLEALLGAELLADWEERLDQAFGDAPRELVGDVGVDYVSFTPGDSPRAVVLVEAVLENTGEAEPEVRRLCQYWTLGVRDGLWTVLDIEDRGQGRYHLVEPFGIQTPA